MTALRQRCDRVCAVREGAASAYRRSSEKREAPAHADPRLHSAGGKLDAARVAARLGVPLKRLAPALGYTPQGLSKNSTSENLQDRLAVNALLHVAETGQMG